MIATTKLEMDRARMTADLDVDGADRPTLFLQDDNCGVAVHGVAITTVLEAIRDGRGGEYADLLAEFATVAAFAEGVAIVDELLTYLGDWDDPAHATCARARAFLDKHQH